MSDFWKTLEPHVTGAIVALIPVATATVIAWIRSRQHAFTSAKSAQLKAEDLSESTPVTIPEQVIERWAIENLRRELIPDEQARSMLKRAKPAVKAFRETQSGKSHPPKSPAPKASDPGDGTGSG